VKVSRFTRQADSTHVVIYGTPAGELLVSYWPSLDAANAEQQAITESQTSEGMQPHARVDSLAELDALEA
jgi:hypothetical protein